MLGHKTNAKGGTINNNIELLNTLEEKVKTLEYDSSYVSSSVKNRRRFYEIEYVCISVMLEVESEYTKEKYN